MKTIYSLREFHNQIKELAAPKGITYVLAEIRMDDRGRLQFRCYALGYEYYTADTPQECIEKLRNALYPLPIFPADNDDVQEVIESEEETKERV